MERAHEIRQIAAISEELTKELDSIADRAFELQKQAKKLADASKRTFSEKGIQADAGSGVGTGTYKLERAKRLAAFAFHPFEKKTLNWKKIRALNVDRVVEETDIRSVMELFADVAFADLEAESGYNLTEANLIKLLQLSQLMLQHMQWSVEQAQHANQLLHEERSALGAAVQLIPDMLLDDVRGGLISLGNEYAKVADADLDAMFLQVRTEERTGAREVAAGVMEQARKEVGVRTAAVQAVGAPGGAGAAPNSTAASVAGGQVMGVQAARPTLAPQAVNALTSARLSNPSSASLFVAADVASITDIVRSKREQGAGKWEGGQRGQGGAPAQALGPLSVTGLAAAQAAFEAQRASQMQRSNEAPSAGALFRPAMAVAQDPFAMAASYASQGPSVVVPPTGYTPLIGAAPSSNVSYTAYAPASGRTSVQQYSSVAPSPYSSTAAVPFASAAGLRSQPGGTGTATPADRVLGTGAPAATGAGAAGVALQPGAQQAGLQPGAWPAVSAPPQPAPGTVTPPTPPAMAPSAPGSFASNAAATNAAAPASAARQQAAQTASTPAAMPATMLKSAGNLAVQGAAGVAGTAAAPPPATRPAAANTTPNAPAAAMPSTAAVAGVAAVAPATKPAGNTAALPATTTTVATAASIEAAGTTARAPK